MTVLVPPGPLMFCICLLYEVMTERQFLQEHVQTDHSVFSVSSAGPDGAKIKYHLKRPHGLRQQKFPLSSHRIPKRENVVINK